MKEKTRNDRRKFLKAATASIVAVSVSSMTAAKQNEIGRPKIVEAPGGPVYL
jgi:hypothetical protein